MGPYASGGKWLKVLSFEPMAAAKFDLSVMVCLFLAPSPVCLGWFLGLITIFKRSRPTQARA